MPDQVILLVIAGLRRRDLDAMPRLRGLVEPGDAAVLAPSFPCLAGPVQASILTGFAPDRHGIVADCFYDRARRTIVRRPAFDAHLEQAAIWDVLRRHDPRLASVCCRLEDDNERGGAARATPLRAAARAASRRPNFLYVCLEDLAAAAQRHGPDSAELQLALAETDRALGDLIAAVEESYGSPGPLWLATGGFAVTPVNGVCLPNRMLREAGLLKLRDSDEGPIADLERSRAFALVDRQISHVFVSDGDPSTISHVAKLFGSNAEIAETLVGVERRKLDLDHPRAGDVVLISTPESWQAYPWWSDTSEAPGWARRIDAAHKLGADPLELFACDGRVPLDLALIKGSHGAPARDERQRSILLSSEPGVIAGGLLADADVCDLALRQFGI